MPCLIVLVAMMAPRFCMICMALFTDWFHRSFESAMWPVLGWLFAPFTTLAYMAAMLNNDHRVDGMWLVLVIVGVLADLGIIGSSKRGD